MSSATIAIPMLCGALLALFLYPRLSDASVDFVGFALFVSVALSVTAFPVLARILAERNLLKTNLGAVTLACAAAADVGAWAVLAVILAVVRTDAAAHPLWVTLAGTAAFVAGAFLVLRPLLQRLERLHATRGHLTQDVLAGVLLILLAASATTEWLGVHALFGAFVIGTAIPREREFVRDLTERLEDVTVVLFLPLFFAAAGLRTSIGLVSGGEMWGYTALICGVAIVAKYGGSTLAARAGGLSWREASALGVLMNTRGLMELVILTIGLDLGLISPALFAMLVIMAIATTFITTPLLEWVYPTRLILEDTETEDAPDAPFTVVVPVSLPSSGPALFRAARALAPPAGLRIYGLHLARPETQSALDVTAPVETLPAATPLGPLLNAAQGTGVDVRPLDFVSRDPGRDIADVARQKAADLVLIGWHKPVVSESVLGGHRRGRPQAHARRRRGLPRTDVPAVAARARPVPRRAARPGRAPPRLAHRAHDGRRDHAAPRRRSRVWRRRRGAGHLPRQHRTPRRAVHGPRRGARRGRPRGLRPCRRRRLGHVGPRPVAVHGSPRAHRP